MTFGNNVARDYPLVVPPVTEKRRTLNDMGRASRLPIAIAAFPLLVTLISDRVLSDVLNRDTTALLKIAIFIGLLGCVAAAGRRHKSGALIVTAVWVVILLLSVGLATWYPAVTKGVVVRAWVGYLYPFAALFVRWERFGRERVARLLTFLPLICLAFGIGFEVFGYQSVVDQAYTGVPRLQGSLIPAWLAGVSLVATCAAIWLRPRWKYGTLFAVINLLITISTSTRTETVVTVLIVMLMAVRSTPGDVRGRRGRSAILVVGAIFIAALFLPLLIQRGNNASNGGGGTTGGRTTAWSFYLNDVQHSILFGRGIGAGSVAAPPSVEGVYVHIQAPHNSYVQLLLDTGVVGVIALVVAYGIVYRRMRKGLNSYDGALARLFGLGIMFCAIFDNVLVAISFVVPALVFIGILYEPRPEPTPEQRRGKGLGMYLSTVSGPYQTTPPIAGAPPPSPAAVFSKRR